MRIDVSGLHASRKPTQDAPDAGAERDVTPARDTAPVNVSVSSRARLLAMAHRALQDAPDVRRSAVEAARQRLSDPGACDGRTIARAMIESISEDAA